MEALKTGVKNLERHLRTVRAFGLPAVVALNKFASDSDAVIACMEAWAKEQNVPLALSEVFTKGSEGGVELAEAVLASLTDVKYEPIYRTGEDLFQKIEKICTKVYGATGIEYLPEALQE